MKKSVLILVAIFSLSLYSCRETTQEKTEDAVEAIGEDIEDNVNKAGEKVEEGAKKVEKEIDEEIHEDDI
jgi:gas vesicle protein